MVGRYDVRPAAGTLGLLILAGSWELAEAKPVNCERKQIECQSGAETDIQRVTQPASKLSIATSGLATSSLETVEPGAFPQRKRRRWVSY